jgi:hypothetical protein
MGIDREISAVRRRGIGWHAITLLLLLAFAFQSYLTQTHIHGSAGTPSQACVSKCVVHTSLPHSPFGDAAVCPLCQAIVHAGAFSAPATLAAVVPHLWVESLIPAMRGFALRTASVRNGLSRAPPAN